MHNSLSPRQCVLGGLLAVLAIVTVVLPADSPAARADACTAGLPQRVLLSADLSFNDVQSCMDNEWVTVLRIQRGEGTRWTVNQPTDDSWKIDARSLFDLSTYNPIATIRDFKEALASGRLLDPDEKVAWKIKLANVKAQVLLARSGRPANEGCTSRSRRYSLADRQIGGKWAGPVSVLPSTEPSTITYTIDASVSAGGRAAIMSAIGQYPDAVDSQDAAFDFPRRLLPHDPGDTSPPTILFKEVVGLKSPEGVMVAGLTKPDVGVVTAVTRRWVTGTISISADPVQQFPRVVGHEIGHVLGLDHMPDNVSSTMDGEGSFLVDSVPWANRTSDDPTVSVAFDECMFLPAN